MSLGPITVAAEFDMSPDQFRAWRHDFLAALGGGEGEPGPGVSPWPYFQSPDTVVTVCYLRGMFAQMGSVAPGASGYVDTNVVVMHDGMTEMLDSGPSERLPVISPPPAATPVATPPI